MVAIPTASGSSAAITPRKTKSESTKRIGKASSSARAMSSETCVPTCSWATELPPSATSGSSPRRSWIASTASPSSFLNVATR